MRINAERSQWNVVHSVRSADAVRHESRSPAGGAGRGGSASNAGAAKAQLPALAEASPRFATGGNRYASAALIAQLLAERLGLPQTRRLRRAEPQDARRAYENAARPASNSGALHSVRV